MSKLRWLSLAIALGGCSFALQPRASLDRRARQPSALPIIADGALAAGALAVGIPETQVSCSSSQWLCLSSIDHAVGGVAVGVAVVFAVSALYGYTRYTQDGAVPDTRARDLADHAAIMAHAGDCATAADSATALQALDRDAYVKMLEDEVIQLCLLRASDVQRRAVLDAIAHAPGTIPLAVPPSAQR